MKIELRPERPADYRQTENVTREAFWNHFVPGCSEHYLLHVLRGTSAFVPRLDVVALLDGRVVGNAVCLKSSLKTDDGKEYEVLTLGPISVLPQYQRKGIGGRMIEYLKTEARNMGFRAILLCGDPDYYLRQGFVTAERLGIRTSNDMYVTALHVCELYEGALKGIEGRYFEDAAYEIDETAAARFDRTFPHKELVSGTPSQKRFEQIVALRREAGPK